MQYVFKVDSHKLSRKMQVSLLIIAQILMCVRCSKQYWNHFQDSTINLTSAFHFQGFRDGIFIGFLHTKCKFRFLQLPFKYYFRNKINYFHGFTAIFESWSKDHEYVAAIHYHQCMPGGGRNRNSIPLVKHKKRKFTIFIRTCMKQIENGQTYETICDLAI